MVPSRRPDFEPAMDAKIATDYSPFSPGLPASVDQFFGREREIRDLSKLIDLAATGKFQVAFLSGDRGIGKSSLASYAKSYAEVNASMVGVHVFLGGTDSLNEMTRRVFERVLREGNTKKWYEPIKGLFGNSVQSADLFGLKLEFVPKIEQLESLTRSFAHAVRNLTVKLREAKKGVGLTLILDDINGLAAMQQFADWLKSLIDEIALDPEPTPLCLIIVGLEERRQSLVALQPSLARAFKLFPIEPWDEVETKTFFTKAFRQVGTTVQSDGLDLMAMYAGGRPEMAQEIGDATFTEDTDKRIDNDDASSGVLKAVAVMGQKYLRKQVLDEIRSKQYRSTLHKIASSVQIGELEFERSKAKDILSPEEARNIDNFLRRMKEIGVITSVGEEAGTYKFATYVHHLYLRLEGKPPSVPQVSAKKTKHPL